MYKKLFIEFEPHDKERYGRRPFFISEELFYEMCESLAILGAKSDLLGSLGSLNDTMTEDDVIMDVKYWNKLHTDRPNI